MMTDEEIGALQAQLPRLRRERVSSEFGAIPRSIRFLRECITRENEHDSKKALYSLLLGECSRAGIHDVTLCVLREQLNAFPDDPLAYTGLASAMADEHVADNGVFALLQSAIELASSQNVLLRYCLNCQARLALKLLNKDAFNKAIGRLIEDAPEMRDQDIGLEFDFLSSIPADFADEEQLEKYRSLQSR